MPFPSALTTEQYTQLRGDDTTNPTYWASEFVVFGSNVVVMSARVNGAPTGTSYAQVTYDGASGSYTNIIPNMTVLIGADSDPRNATFIGRARKNGAGVIATSTILYINETSALIPDNAYIWVIRDYRLQDRLSRQVGLTQYSDYDISYQPASPYITGINPAYVNVVSGTPEGYTIAFTPTGNPIASGSTINNSSWQWLVPSDTAGATFTVGSNTSQNPTIRFDAGYSDWVTVYVSDSNGQYGFFHFYVGAVPTDFSAVITPAVNNVNLTLSENGWDGTLDAFAGVNELLDNTLCIVFDIEMYNGSEGSIFSNVRFVGRIRKENNATTSDATYNQLQQVTYDLEGMASQFGRVEHLPFTLRNSAAPTVFDEMVNLTVWRGIAYTLYWRSTFLEIFPLSFDSTDNTFLYPVLPTQGGNIFAIIKELADNINAVLQAAPTGEVQIVRNALFLTTAQRNALTTVANFDLHDYIDFTLEINQVDIAGKVQAYGGYYNALSGNVIALASIAPGLAQGIGEGINTFSRNVLAVTSSQDAAQAELNSRAGNQYEIVRKQQPTLTVTMPDGYDFITASANQWYTWTLTANEDTGGRAYTTADRWQCIAGSQTHDMGAGTKAIQYTFRLESQGTPGTKPPDVPPDAVTPSLPVIPPLPAFPSLPPLPSIYLPPTPTPGDLPPYSPPTVISNGNVLAAISSIQEWATPNALLTSSPTFNEGTPQDSLTYTAFQWVGLGSKGGYLLGNDGTDTTLFYSEDATAANPVWSSTVLSSVLYSQIRVGSTSGALWLVGTGGGTSTDTYDFTIDQQGWDALVNSGFSPSTLANYSPGVGWTQHTNDGVAFPTNRFSQTDIVITLPASTFRQIDVYYDNLSLGNDSGSPNYPQLVMLVDGSPIQDTSNVPTGSGVVSWVGTSSGSEVTIILNNSFRDDSVTCTGTGTITKVEITHEGGGAISTRYSSNYGSTFGSDVSVGTATGADTGSDSVKVGTTILVAADGQVRKASAGGSYSDYGDPLPAGFIPACIWIPYYKIGSTSVTNSATNPDYVIVSSGLDSATESVYLVTDAGTTFNAITPIVSAVKGVGVGANCLTMPFKSGKRMAAVLSFSGTRKLVVSTNIGTSDTFTSRGAVGTGAQSVRYRRGDNTFNQLAIGNGSTGLLVSQNNGVSLLSKGNPGANALIFADFF